MNKSNLTFNVVDLEASNRNGDISQIGIVHIKDGEITDKWSTFVNPESDIDPFYTNINNITKETVKGAPTFPEIRNELDDRLTDSIVVSHSPYDPTTFCKAMDKYELDQLKVIWLDSVKIAREAWPGLPDYKLDTIAKHLGISFKHHDALEDALCAAKITLAACNATGFGVHSWLNLSQKPKPKKAKEIRELTPYEKRIREIYAEKNRIKREQEKEREAKFNEGKGIQGKLNARLHNAVIKNSGYAEKRKKLEQSIQSLIDRGADVNAVDKDGIYPIHKACWKSTVERVEQLINNGADLEARCPYNEHTPDVFSSPLDLASMRGYEELVKLLIAKGANVKENGANETDAP